jgi:mannose-6-phosphate isomerase-like protein (cupin superfamily)
MYPVCTVLPPNKALQLPGPRLAVATVVASEASNLGSLGGGPRRAPQRSAQSVGRHDDDLRKELPVKELRAYDPSAVADSLAEMDFRQLARFDAGHAGVFWSEAGGPSPWEMHPDCDEMLQVLEGEIEVEVLPEDGGAGVKTLVAAGSFLVMPRGCWHRQNLLARTKELYLTPGRSLQSTASDQRRNA